MEFWTRRLINLNLAMVLAATAMVALSTDKASGQVYVQKVPDDMSAAGIWQELRNLRDDTELRRDIRLQKIVTFASALAERFPESSYRNEALIMKLSALSGLAATNPPYAAELLRATDAVSGESPTGKLASENAYFTIQAFVYTARAEGMPEEKVLAGAEERYRAFIEDHSDSGRQPVIMASLVRNLVRQEKIEQATQALARLKTEFPDNDATKRASGEIRRKIALNKPIRLKFTPESGPEINTDAMRGKVAILHLWSAWTEPGIKSFNPMARLYQEFGDNKLLVHGLNLDRQRERADILIKEKKIPWPQSFDTRGYRCELAQDFAILRMPAFFVIDAQGVLQYLGQGERVEEVVRSLLKEPGKAD
ncbi:MAG: redoxin domain-containing protein [Planctomycetota bacterium]|jgi:thiol-disulfide isomerase/thioredoxin